MRENRLLKSLHLKQGPVIDEKGLNTFLKQVQEKTEPRGKKSAAKSKAKVLSISTYPEDRAVFNALRRYLEDATGKNISVSTVYRTALYAAQKDEKFLELFRKLDE